MKRVYLAVAAVLAIVALAVGIAGRGGGEGVSETPPVEEPDYSYSLTGVCSLDQGLSCTIYVGNQGDASSFYIEGMVLHVNGTPYYVDLGMAGASVPPNSHGTLHVFFGNESATVCFETVQRTVIIRASSNLSEPVIEGLEEVAGPLEPLEARGPVTMVLGPGEGSILPLDYEFNASNRAYLVGVNVSASGPVLYDVKLFAGHDLLYYEHVSTVEGNYTGYIPVPGYYPYGVTYSRVVLNIINPGDHEVNATASLILYGQEGLRIELVTVAGRISLRVPLVQGGTDPCG